MNDYRTISVSSLLSKYGTMTGIKTTTITFFKFKTFDEFYEWMDAIDEDNRVHVYCHNDLQPPQPPPLHNPQKRIHEFQDR
jgi:hypothetical protein